MTYAIAFLLSAALLLWTAELIRRALRAENLFVLRLDNDHVRVLLVRSAAGHYEVARALDIPFALARFEVQRMVGRVRAPRAVPAGAPRSVAAVQGR